MKHLSFLFLLFTGLLPSMAQAQHVHPQSPIAETTKAPPPATEAMKVSLPDITVLNQEGKKLNFYRDLVKGKTVAINFIFTTCTTICPPLGVNFAKIQTLLGSRMNQDIHLISITVDPVTDTPERLQSWSTKFSPLPGWTLVTGNKSDIDQLLKALGGFSARKEDHSPVVLVGNEAQGNWTRAYGLAKPSQLAALLNERAGTAQTPHHHPQPLKLAPPPAQKYFTDVELINQYGEPLRFYSDLIKNRVVIINTFFSTCTSVCPPMNRNFMRLQQALGERLGKDVFILSISIDPVTDTPERLKAYAARYEAKPGWHFLTGKPDNVAQALRKLGQFVEDKNDHLTIVLIGNDQTGLWKKAHGLARADVLFAVVQSVLEDQLPSPTEGGK